MDLTLLLLIGAFVAVGFGFLYMHRIVLLRQAGESAYKKLSRHWEIEELAIEWVLSNRDMHITALITSPAFRYLMPKEHRTPESKRIDLLIRAAFEVLRHRDEIDYTVEFLTRHEVRHQWARFKDLSPVRRLRFEEFLDENNDSEDGMHGNVIRLTLWLEAYKMENREMRERLNNVGPLLGAGKALIPVLLIRAKDARTEE